MASKQFITALLALLASLLFSSCLSRDPEATNQLLINNTTEDTIVLSEYRYKHSKEDSIYMDLVGEEEYRIQFHNCYIILPNECYFLGGTTIPAMDIIRRNYQDLSREIKIYKLACDASDGLKMIECNSRDTLYVEKQHRVSWLPPLQYLSDSVHSFYNIKSWVIKKGGKKNKWERATFTITEDDLK